ncbi:MAG: hypothetical protein IT454_08235 [Planctomycetes bacterium]|nr:hypothetical protein [Planctomycetota bacterium]
MAMDLGNYWQENKRFLMSVGIGAVVFLGAWMAIDSSLGAKLRAQQGRRSKLEVDLRSSMFSGADLERAKEQNAALVQAAEALRENVEFVARPEFRMEKGVPASSRYFTVLERTREDLKRRAGRAGLFLPPDLGMPLVSPTKEAELVRYLEALDAIEQVVQHAITAGCARLDSIRVKLDSRLLGGKPINDVEKTVIELKFVGPAMPMTRLITLLQDQKAARVLTLETLDIAPARSKNSDDVKMELTLLVAHLNRVGLAKTGEDAQ